MKFARLIISEDYLMRVVDCWPKPQDQSKMAWLSTYFAIILSTIITTVLLYFKLKFGYWKRRNVPHLPGKVPFGSLKGVSTEESIGEAIADVYLSNPEERFVGGFMFAKPFLVLRDLDLIKDVLVKRFGHFYDRGISVDVETEPLSGKKSRY